ncbi:MAG TPA: uracil-DNA glycosylase family protein, partial [Hyphomonadaceae bacterium]|nr:uracil-DNA glycosylase family protein [Hyphomonadaceae bacterium]
MRKGTTAASNAPPEAPLNCPLCPRLFDFRTANAKAHPGWHNAPVESFGDASGRLLIVGLAPGLQGANKTGRPFTGDYAGDLLYSTLDKFGFSTGKYQARPDDGLKLKDAIISNAVRCVPP